MTPKRTMYFQSLSKLELMVRSEILDHKIAIRQNKANIQWIKQQHPKHWEERLADNLYCISRHKLYLNIYRHELARLKGMDRVVVPREAEYELTLEGHTGYCCCGNFLMENCLNKKANIHCDKCGRRILWEKVI